MRQVPVFSLVLFAAPGAPLPTPYQSPDREALHEQRS
jgi:hypothetical protein